MQAMGIVRQLDELGRIVVPREIRRSFRIREGDTIEILVGDEGEMILEKYSPVLSIGKLVQNYSDALHQATEKMVCITDTDKVVAAAGISQKMFMNRPLSMGAVKVMEKRQSMLINNTYDHEIYNEETGGISKFIHEAIAPIISQGDAVGTVIIGTKNENSLFGDTELKLVETAAAFITKLIDL